MRYFIITVDTEGDDQWGHASSGTAPTENARFIPRFQSLCEEHGMVPTYLVDYEMAADRRFTDFIKYKVSNGLCETGVHVHAWNTPPEHALERKYSGNPYLIEYPDDVMELKFAGTLGLIEDRIGTKALSHRAGRWVMDDRYFTLLEKYGIIADCSFTPGISWARTEGATRMGCDYSGSRRDAHLVGRVLEIPMTIRHFGHYIKGGHLLHMARTAVKGGNIWFRPAISSKGEMLFLLDKISEEPDTDYIEFMVHSSELMPGGSPYFKTEEDIDRLYSIMSEIFSKAAEAGYKGISLSGYAESKIKGL